MAQPVGELELLATVLSLADVSALDVLIAALTTQLTSQARTIPKEKASKLIRVIDTLQQRREDLELAANLERRAGIARVAGHFARKAQSGWSGRPFPEDTAPAEGD